MTRTVEREVFLPLHALADMRELLETEIYFAEGELTPAMERQWDRISGTAREKVYRFGLWVCEQEAAIAGIDHESERLADRRRATEKRIASRKRYVAPIMERMGLRLVQGPLCTVALHRNTTLTVERADGARAQNDLFASPLREAHPSHHVRIK